MDNTNNENSKKFGLAIRQEEAIKPDVNEITLEHTALVDIPEFGIHLKELGCRSPVRGLYVKIIDIINMMNRGITVEFCDHPCNKVVIPKIEEFLTIYNERANEINAKGGSVETGAKALETIREDSRFLSKKIESESKETNAFDIESEYDRIRNNLQNNSGNILNIYENELYDSKLSNDEMMKERINRERLEEDKKNVRESLAALTDAYSTHMMINSNGKDEEIVYS